jgi:hypothetical protein
LRFSSLVVTSTACRWTKGLQEVKAKAKTMRRRRQGERMGPSGGVQQVAWRDHLLTKR